MPENYLSYLDGLISQARVQLNNALDDDMDDTLAFARSARLHTLLEVRVEAGDYEPA